MEIKKEDWENTKIQNENFIKNNLMQIEMAKEVIVMCDRKIKEFEDEKE